MFGFGPRYATSEAVTLNKDTVVKKVDPLLMEIEVGVTQAARELARTSGLFCVPQIIRYDHRSGVIEFERIEGYITLRQLLSRTDDNLEVIRRVGTVLAHIHGHLRVPHDLRFGVLSQCLSTGGDVVPIHGDFNTINVGYKRETNVIVVLDWASAPILDKRVTMGPRYFDLAHFLRSLLVHQSSTLEAIRRFNCRANMFIESYQKETAKVIDLHTLRGVLLYITGFRIKQQLRRKSFLSAISNVMWYVLLRNLTREW